MLFQFLSTQAWPEGESILFVFIHFILLLVYYLLTASNVVLVILYNVLLLACLVKNTEHKEV